MDKRSHKERHESGLKTRREVLGAEYVDKSMAAVDDVAAACRAHGKQWGAVTPSPGYATTLAEKGCSLISLTNDVKLVSSGLAKVREEFSDFWS